MVNSVFATKTKKRERNRKGFDSAKDRIENNHDQFEKNRGRMLDRMEKIAKKRGEKVITKTIRFTNNDVPNFLKKLDDFEKKSKKASIAVSIQKDPGMLTIINKRKIQQSL